jgi:hypothetical protein
LRIKQAYFFDLSQFLLKFKKKTVDRRIVLL